MIAVIYGPGDRKRLVDGPPAIVALNIQIYEAEAGVEARVLDDTALSNLASVMDQRLPATLAEFDQAFPTLQNGQS